MYVQLKFLALLKIRPYYCCRWSQKNYGWSQKNYGWSQKKLGGLSRSQKNYGGLRAGFGGYRWSQLEDLSRLIP